MKRARVLHLWRMPQLRKLDQLRTGDRLHRAFSQLGITPSVGRISGGARSLPIAVVSLSPISNKVGVLICPNSYTTGWV
jgi:hypothetical protein